MSDYDKPPRAVRRAAAASKREHWRVLAAGARRAGVASRQSNRLLSAVQGCRWGLRPSPRRRARPACPDQRPRRRHHGRRDRISTCARRRLRSRSRRPATCVRHVRAQCLGRWRTHRLCRTRPDFAFALDEVLAAITPNTRIVFLTKPEQPNRHFDAERRHQDDRASGTAGCCCICRRGVRGFRGDHVRSRAHELSQCHRRAHVCESVRPGRPAPGHFSRRSHRARSRFAAPSASTASTSRLLSRFRRRFRTAATSKTTCDR